VKSGLVLLPRGRHRRRDVGRRSRPAHPARPRGHPATVAAAIRRKATTLGLDPTRRKNADTTATYLINKKPYLDYPTALAAGWPIATGIIEGACRQLVKGRMDITGARRGLDGAVPKPSCGYAP
jgi:hypothetical protein